MFSIEILFILIVLFLFFGLPFLIKSVDYPSELEFELLSPRKIPTWAQEFVAEQNVKHRAEGFHSGPCFTVKNIDYDNVNQFFFHDENILGTTSILKQPDADEVKEYGEYATPFTEENLLVTRSVSSFDMFYSPPGYHILTYPGFHYPQPLLTQHRALQQKLQNKGLRVAPLNTVPDKLLKFQQSIQQNILQYQLERKLLRKDNDTSRLRGTFRLAFSILSQSLNPLDIAIGSTVLFTTTVFSLLNVFLSIKVIPALFPFSEVSSYLINGLYSSIFTISGILTGLFFLRKVFPWALASSSLIVLFVLHFQPALEPLGADLFIISLLSCWLGQTIRTYTMKIQGFQTFLYPLSSLLIVLFLSILYG